MDSFESLVFGALTPSSWPLVARRIFLLTLPFSLPLLVAGWALLIGLFTAFMFGLLFLWALTPFVNAGVWCCGSVASLWKDTQSNG